MGRLKFVENAIKLDKDTLSKFSINEGDLIGLSLSSKGICCTVNADKTKGLCVMVTDDMIIIPDIIRNSKGFKDKNTLMIKEHSDHIFYIVAE